MYVIMGYGKHQEMLKPYYRLAGGIDFTFSFTEAKAELEWQKKHNPYADWKIYKLEEVK